MVRMRGQSRDQGVKSPMRRSETSVLAPVSHKPHPDRKNAPAPGSPETLWTTFTQLQNICFLIQLQLGHSGPPGSPPSGDYPVIDEKRNTTGMRNTRNPANSEITKQTQSHKWTVHRIDKPIRFSQNSAALRAHERESRQTARVVGYSETIKPLQGSRPNFSRCLVDIAGPEIAVSRLISTPVHR
jgi:hypothetical protein